MHQYAVPYQTAIHEQVNGVAIQLLDLRLGNETMDAHLTWLRRRLVFFVTTPGRGLRESNAFEGQQGRDGKKLLKNIFSKNLVETLAMSSDRSGDEQSIGRGVQLKMLIGMSQGVMCHQRCDMREFRRFCLEKFLSRRRIEEKIAHSDRCP